jgi:DNA-binding Lrp family transcriptional regulator
MSAQLDAVDRALPALLQADATNSYAALAGQVGLSAAAVHDRVRTLRERGVIRRTTVNVDPEGVGLSTLAFVLLHSTTWMGDEETAAAITAQPAVQEAHSLHDIEGVSETETVMVLETMFERAVDVQAPSSDGVPASAGRG